MDHVRDLIGQDAHPNWDPNNNTKHWNRTSEDVYDRSTVREYKFEDDGFVWKYRLWVRAAVAGIYTFWDESGDKYDLDITQTADALGLAPHYVDYNSDQPKIMRITYTHQGSNDEMLDKMKPWKNL